MTLKALADLEKAQHALSERVEKLETGHLGLGNGYDWLKARVERLEARLAAHADRLDAYDDLLSSVDEFPPPAEERCAWFYDDGQRCHGWRSDGVHEFRPGRHPFTPPAGTPASSFEASGEGQRRGGMVCHCAHPGSQHIAGLLSGDKTGKGE